MTIAEWFSKRPEAVEAVRCWLEGLLSGDDDTRIQAFVRHLIVEHDYPYRGPTGFRKWALYEFGETYTEAVSMHRAPAIMSFARSTDDIRALERSENFVIGSAVNNCDVIPGFWSAIGLYCEEKQGERLFNPVRYYNPKSPKESENLREKEWWAPELDGHMLDDEIRPHPLLSFMTTKAQATAANPLPARVSGRTKARSAVIGHPQLCMRTVPTPQEKLPKLLYTTGAVTEKRYGESLAGDQAQFHHTAAAVVVEIRGDRFHLREITWDGEKFIDYDKAYYADHVEDAPPPEAISMGDIHAPYGPAENVMEATFGPGGIYDVLHPRRLFLHDLGDMKSVNPHEQGKRLTRAAMWRDDKTNLYQELLRTKGWLLDLPEFEEVLVVRSNHDYFLDRWLETGERNVEPENAEMYHRLAGEMLAHHRRHGAFPIPFEVALRWIGQDPFPENIRFLKFDESYQLLDVEMGMHGHLGPNGARGSIRNLSQIGTRSIVGHGHGPGIWQGVYMGGLSAEYRQGYNIGPSGWLQSHVLLHANGYRQMCHIIKNHWRG